MVQLQHCINNTVINRTTNLKRPQPLLSEDISSHDTTSLLLSFIYMVVQSFTQIYLRLLPFYYLLLSWSGTPCDYWSELNGIVALLTHNLNFETIYNKTFSHFSPDGMYLARP